jgi:glycine cleavage system H lipoate-binding protein
VVAAVNAAVLADPELVLREPYDSGWLAEFAEAGSANGLLGGEDARAWFAREIADYREKGLLAE